MRVLHEGLGGGFHRFLVARGEGAQRMLHAIAELAEDFGGHVVGELRAEIHAHALGADDADHLFHALAQRRRGVVEQQMGFVEEEHQLGFVQIAHFRQVLEQLGEQPQQESGVQAGFENELVGGEDVDHATPGKIGAHQVVEIERWFAEEQVSTVLLQSQQGTLDGADGRRADESVAGGDFLAFFGGEVQQRSQVVDIQQQPAIVVGQLEHDVEHAGLGVVEFEHARQQRRADLGDCGAHRMAVLAEHVPEHRRAAFVGVAVDADLRDACGDLLVAGTGHGKACDIALHIGQEHRHALARETLGKHHQRDRFAGAGGAGDQAMAIAILGQQVDLATVRGGDGLADEDVVHGQLPCGKQGIVCGPQWWCAPVRAGVQAHAEMRRRADGFLKACASWHARPCRCDPGSLGSRVVFFPG